MASKAIQRTLLIVALLATAHVVKPFSLRSVATHLIHSATSFSFILPGSAAGSLEQADYLATALDNGFRMMEARQESNWTRKESDWVNQTTFASNLMPPQTQSDNVKPFTASLPCRDAAKTVTKTVTKAKPRPAKRLIALGVTKSEEKAVENVLVAGQALANNLPAIEIENMIAVSLPTIKTQLPPFPKVSPNHRVTAANSIVAASSKTCPMEEIKLLPLTREDAEQRLRTTILQHFVYVANSVKLACAQERSRTKKNTTHISVKPS